MRNSILSELEKIQRSEMLSEIRPFIFPTLFQNSFIPYDDILEGICSTSGPIRIQELQVLTKHMTDKDGKQEV